MTDSDLIDLIAIVGAALLTLGTGLLVGSLFGVIPAIGASSLVLGSLLILYAIPASRAEQPTEEVES